MAQAASQALASSGNFVVPAGVTSITIDIAGGGGGGGGGAFTYGGGGGGGGASRTGVTISVTPGQAISYSVGTGGTGGSAGSYSVSGGKGDNGGQSYFGSYVSVDGGKGGKGGVVGGSGGQGGSAGGTGGTDGGSGDSASGQRNYGGSGGATLLGAGGSGGYGNSSKITLPTTGTNGAGGGGASGWQSASDAGAKGASGTIVVSYTDTPDLTAPTATVAYSTTAATNGSVVATITTSETVTVTNNGGLKTRTFTANGSFTFNFKDAAGNTGSVTATVSNIDKTAPTATVAYSTTAATNGNVTATITLSETVTVTNNGGLKTYTFTANGSFTFSFTDIAGNTGSVLATVSSIDKTAPVITIAPYILTPTNQDIIVTASTNEGTLNTTSHTFTANGSFSFVATDTAGNVTTSTITISNIDKVVPVITLLGANPVTVAYGSVYADAGATASDNIDGNITANIVVTNPVNTNILGSYTVSYSVSDSFGNTATQVTRTINVIDTTAPAITILGNNPETVNQGAVYTDAGATALDDTDGAITPIVTGSVDTAIIGSYTITYTATDAAGNTATANRMVNVTAAPITTYDIIATAGANGTIAPLGTISVTAGADQTYTITPDAGYDIATLTVDGVSIATSTTYTFTNVQAAHTIDAGFALIATPDTTAPIITILGNNPETVTQGSIYLDAGATALDNIDGDITANIITTNNVSTSTVGTYTVVYSVSDLAGNVASSTRTVSVVSTPIVSPLAINLGTAGNFVALAKSGISTTGTTAITGNIGVSPIAATAITGFGLTLDASNQFATSALVNGKVYAADYAVPTPAVMTTAVNDMQTAYTDGAGRTLPDYIELGAGNIGGMTLAPGLYKWSTGVTIPTDVTLTGSATDVWIFQIAQTLDISSARKVLLSGGAQASNIFWVVAGQTTLGTNSVFNGNILDQTAIVLNTGATLNGRALAQTAVTLDANIVSSPVPVVSDILPPVITMLGTNPESVVINTVYTDAGATALDNVDGDVTANIITNNPVNIAVVGTYTVTYSVSDSSGNSATSTRTVDIISAPVVDTTPPSSPIISVVNTVATTTLGATLTALWSDSTDDSGSLAGYSFVWDGVAGTDPDNIVEGQATTTTATLVNGTWYFHIVAVDPVLNISTPTTTFGPIVINNALAGDTTAPTGPTTVTSSTHTVGVSSATTTVSLDWDTATDDVALAGYSYIWDTNASSTPDTVADTVATTLTTNLSNGSWYFHILSTDTAGNVSSPVIDFGPVIIATTTTDIISPVGPTTVTSSSHTVSVTSTNQSVVVSWDTATDDTALAGYSYIWDNASSTVPDAIPETAATTATTNLSNGSWYFHILSTDTAGNVSSPVIDFGPVIINATPPADITPPSAPIATIATTSATTIDASWTASTDDSGSLAGYSFVWDTNALTNPDVITETQSTSTSVTVPDGLWYFHLAAVDPSLNVSTPTTTVGPVKVDTTAPVLTLLGATIVPVVIGGSYTDAGATALDNIDGDITASIIATSTVNTNVLGTYTVTYTATDAAGNIATAIRTVNVVATPPVDTTAPAITILGNNPETVTQGAVYLDAGATALDDTDGAITPVTTGSVDTSIIGSYPITYTATDAAGNTATANRMVNVTSTPVTTYYILATAGANGTIAPAGTTSVMQGANQTYTITANSGYDIATLTVDGVSIATSTSYTFTNVQAGHTIDAGFAAAGVDTIAPSSVAITFSSHATNTISSNLTVAMSWSDATDTGGSGLAGYSYVFDTASSTTPDIVIEGTAPTTSQILAYGTYYFHLHAVDVAGNSGAVAHYGPILISDSNVLILNSTIGGIYYDVYSPTLVQATLASTTGATTITNSTVSNWWEISNSTLSGVTFDNAIVSGVTATNSTIINSDLTNCTIINSLVKNYFASGCSISDSIVDPPSGMNDLTGSTVSGNSQIYASSVTYSTVVDSYIATSTISYSTLINATSTNSTLANTTVTGGSVDTSTISNTTLSNSTVTNSSIINATISGSTLDTVTVLGTATTIVNSDLSGTTVTDATIADGIMSEGMILLPDGTPVIVSTSTPLTNLVNYAPAASFTVSVSDLGITLTDTTTDPNSGGTLGDGWTYVWDFGNGVIATTTGATLGSDQAYTYATPGTYVVTVTVTDAFGKTSVFTTSVTVAFPPAPPAPAAAGGYGGAVIFSYLSSTAGGVTVAAPAITTVPTNTSTESITSSTDAKSPSSAKKAVTRAVTKTPSKTVIATKKSVDTKEAKIAQEQTAQNDQAASVLSSISDDNSFFARIKEFVKKVFRRIKGLW